MNLMFLNYFSLPFCPNIVPVPIQAAWFCSLHRKEVIAESYPVRTAIQFSRCIEDSSLSSKSILELNQKSSHYTIGKKFSVWTKKNFNIPSLIWTKGAEMHTHFPVKSKKIQKIKVLSLVWTEKGLLSPPISKKIPKNFSKNKTPSLVWTGKGQTHT